MSSGQRWALMHELRGAPEPSLEQLLAQLALCDLVLVEGYKRDRQPKIEVRRDAGPEGRIADGADTICAIASPTKALAAPHEWLALDDTAAIADFVSHKCGL